jgi:hypothetical protein
LPEAAFLFCPSSIALSARSKPLLHNAIGIHSTRANGSIIFPFKLSRLTGYKSTRCKTATPPPPPLPLL